MIRIMVQVSDTTKQQLDAMRVAQGVPTAAWIRRLIERELADPREPEPTAAPAPEFPPKFDPDAEEQTAA